MVVRTNEETACIQGVDSHLTGKHGYESISESISESIRINIPRASGAEAKTCKPAIYKTPPGLDCVFEAVTCMQQQTRAAKSSQRLMLIREG